MKNLSSINETQDIVTKKYVDDIADTKVTKIDGKGLSTNDFTNEEKEKLANVENYTLPKASSDALGGVIIGSGLKITEEGVLSVTGGGSGGGAPEIAISEEEPTDENILLWIDPNEEGKVVSLINYCGEYNSETSYSDNDLVTYDNSWYLCHTPVTGTSPNASLGFSDPYWYPIGGSNTEARMTTLETKTSTLETKVSTLETQLAGVETLLSKI